MNITVKNYQFLNPVGVGKFTQVIKALNTKDNEYFAIKLFSANKLSDPIIKKLVNSEINSLNTLQEHPYIIKKKETFEEDDYFFIVYDYCEGGTLESNLTLGKLD